MDAGLRDEGEAPRISVRDEGGLLQRIRHYASAEGLSKSDAVRRLIQLGLQTAEQGVLDVRGLIPEIHNKLAELQGVSPKSPSVHHALLVSALETVMHVRQLAKVLDPSGKALVAGQREAKSEIERFKKEGVL